MEHTQPPGDDRAPSVPLQPLRIDVEEGSGRARLRLAGELDLASGQALQSQLDVLGERPKEVVLDLHELTFIDSAGLRLIVELWHESQRDGYELLVVPGPPPVQRVFALTGLDEVLPFGAARPVDGASES